MSTVVPWERSRGMIPQATAPVNPSAGQEYVRSSDYHLMRYNGSSWVDTDAGGGGGGGLSEYDARKIALLGP